MKEAMYGVYWCGGDRDGELLGMFDSENSAFEFSAAFEAEHESEFHPCWGGTFIVNESTGKIVEL